MIRNIALALTIAAISTSAAAQTQKPTWDDYLKPYAAKTDPAVPIAAPPPPKRPPIPVSYGTTPPATPNTYLLDGCVISAIGRLPKADGLRVTKSSYEFHISAGPWQFWRVSVAVDLQGRQASYQWFCRINENTTAELRSNPW